MGLDEERLELVILEQVILGWARLLHYRLLDSTDPAYWQALSTPAAYGLFRQPVFASRRQAWRVSQPSFPLP